MENEKKPDNTPEERELTVEEWDELSDGYELETDVKIPYYEPAKQAYTAFPGKYQIPDANLTPVKKQFTSNCWTYAATCSLETFLLGHGIVPSNTDVYADWSEEHVTYDMYDLDSTGPRKNKKGRLPSPPNARRKHPGYGGNRSLAAAYYARGNAAVAKISDPCQPHASTLTARSPETGIKKEKKHYVSGYELLPDPMGAAPSQSFIDNIKRHITDYSSISISLLWNAKEFMNTQTISGKEIRSYYTPKKSLIPKTISCGKHAVSIIGWDDNYSKSNFKQACGVAPKSDGAFLCRNSHGTRGAWDGNFWLSYEDENVRSASCVREVIQDFFAGPRKVYAGAFFGMMEGIEQSTTGVSFSMKYRTEEDDEELTHIGLFNLTPCVADVKLQQAGMADIAIISNKELTYAGYHAVALSQTHTFSAAGTEFTISCKYTPQAYGTVLAPCEKRIKISGQDTYGNIDLQPGHSFVNGKDLYQQKDKYGNVALYAIVKRGGSQGQALQDAYAALSLPAASDNRIDGLPATSHQQPLEWRIEPVEGSLYMPGSPYILDDLKQYTAGSNRGLLNTSATKDISGYVTCVIGTGSFAMKKVFPVTLPAYQSGVYSFTVGKVTDGKNVDVSGTFPVAGATVEVSANNSDKKVVSTDSNGNWSIKGYSLYKDSWDDKYENTGISVTVYDDNKNNILASGSHLQKLEKPFTFNAGAAVAVVLFAGCVGVTIGWLIKNYCCAGSAATCDCAGFALSGTMAGNPYLSVENANMLNDGLIEDAASLKNVHKVKMELPLNGRGARTDFGGLAKRIAKGGFVENCSVSGVCDAGGVNAGGLFLSGEDVTVSDCSVSLQMSNVGEYGGVAHTLSGNCKIHNVTVNGSAAGKTAAGLAVNLSATVEKTAVNIGINATEKAAGIAIVQTGGTIQNVRAACDIQGESSAAGMVVSQSKGSVIKNCYVSGSVVSSGGSAAGIASGVSDEPAAVSGCLCVCSEITGKSAVRTAFALVTSSMAYDKMKFNGTTIAGESLKTAEELLHTGIYTTLGWDVTDIWMIDPKKKYPVLKGMDSVYDFPFPNPYPTKNEVYTFNVGNPIVFYGANNLNTKKIKWSLSSYDHMAKQGEPETLLNQDEFYLQLFLAGTAAATFNFTITSVLDSGEYSVTVPVIIREV